MNPGVNVNVVSAKSPSVGYYLNPVVLLRTLWLHRDLVLQLTWRNVLARYRGSILGLAWSFLLPLMMLAVYTFVFGVVFKARWPHAADASILGFALPLYSGLLVYAVFAETVGAAPSLIIGNPSYVKKVVFPLEILPLCMLGAAIIHFLIGTVVLLLCAVIFNGTVSPTIYWFPVVIIPLLMSTLGVAWFIASLGVYLRDIGQFIGVALQILIYVSPVFFPLDQVPPLYRMAMQLNPLTAIVQNSRYTLLWNKPPEWASLGVAIVASLVVMQLGFVWFMKTKRGFADVI